MPIQLPPHLPAIDHLKRENIVIANHSFRKEGIMPLRVVILNLMPLKEVTETDLVRLLSSSPLNIEVSFMKIKHHVCKNTSAEHMDLFYHTFDHYKNEDYDGMIITGAPVEKIDYEEVTYWSELTEIFDWAHEHVRSTLYICWAAQAGLYYYYGIPKYQLSSKMFGIFKHRVLVPSHAIFRGFDDEFYVPHSRHTEVRTADILTVPELTLLSDSDEAGAYMAVSRGGRDFFITGHSEYEPYTLDTEYKRDLKKGLPIGKPLHYYMNDDATCQPVVRWRAHAHLLFNNWLKYFVNAESETFK